LVSVFLKQICKTLNNNIINSLIYKLKTMKNKKLYTLDEAQLIWSKLVQQSANDLKKQLLKKENKTNKIIILNLIPN